MYIIAAIGLPWWFGYVLTRCVYKEKVIENVLVSIGYGYFLGWLVVSLLVFGMSFFSLTLNHLFICLMFLLLNIFISLYGYKKKITPVRWRLKSFCVSIDEKYKFKIIILLLVGFWLALRFFSIGLELILQPLYPWDAYTSWLPKARFWYLSNQVVPLINYWDWIGSYGMPKEIYVHDSAGERSFASYITFWTALIVGDWDEGSILLPWLLAAMAYVSGFVGQSMIYGVSRWLILLSILSVLSLPILDSHIALPGYVDLWLSFFVGLGVASLYHWSIHRKPRQLILVLLMIIGCYLVKSESGSIWAFLLLVALAVSFFNVSRVVVLWFLLTSCVGFVVLVFIGVDIGDPVSSYHFVMNEKLLKIPYLFNSNTPSFDKVVDKAIVVIRHFFLYASWNMMWPFMMILITIKFNAIYKQMPAAIVFFLLTSVFIIISYVLLVDYVSVPIDTVVNRAFLHVVPSYVCILLFSFVSLHECSEHRASLKSVKQFLG